MGIGVRVFLIAFGAVITFALDVKAVGGLALDTVGVIVLVAGAVGLLASMVILGGRPWLRHVVEERL